MSRTITQEYVLINKEKYVGSHAPIARSTWELAFMRVCDQRKDILKWASEPLKITYHNPLSNKYTVYIPDFFILYVDKHGKKHSEIIEIKPAKESYISEAKSKRDKMRLIVNIAKWKAAQEYCMRRGLFFRIINEDQLFNKYK